MWNGPLYQLIGMLGVMVGNYSVLWYKHLIVSRGQNVP